MNIPFDETNCEHSCMGLCGSEWIENDDPSGFESIRHELMNVRREIFWPTVQDGRLCLPGALPMQDEEIESRLAEMIGM